jgi:hypothetical protein
MSILVIIGSAKAKPGKADDVRPILKSAAPHARRRRLSSLRDE